MVVPRLSATGSTDPYRIVARKINIKIKIGKEERFSLQQLSINQPMNGHHRFSMRCGLQERPNHIVEVAQSAMGELLEVSLMGARSKDQRTNFFRGVVTGVSLSKQMGGQNELLFEGYSESIKLENGTHTQSFLEKSLKDIAGAVADEHGVILSVAKTSHTTPLSYEVQYRETGFHFLNRLANTYGEWFFFDGTDWHFGQPPKVEEVPLKFGKTLFSFDLSLHAQPVRFKMLGYEAVGHEFSEAPPSKATASGLDDYGKLVVGKSEQLFGHEPISMAHHATAGKANLDQLASYRKQQLAAGHVLFEGHSDSHDLKLGSIIKVSGKKPEAKLLSDTVDYGKFRIVDITHIIDGTGQYQNHFQAISADLTAPPVAKSVHSPIAEVQIAEVVDNKDEEKLGRVKVQFQWQQAVNGETPWLRVATNGAGGTHGMYVVPEIGDQVLVAFEHGNPNRPYVQSSLYHGKAKPADGLADADNNFKAIKTRSGNLITLSDEAGKEAIKIENGTNTVILSLEGDTSIAIQTSGDMSLSAKNINITAEEGIQVQCKEWTLTADDSAKTSTDKFKVEAQSNAEIAAMQNAKLAGTSKTSIGDGGQVSEVKGTMVTVEGTATTAIKGAMVKLN